MIGTRLEEGPRKEEEKVQNQFAVSQMYYIFVVVLLHLSFVYDLQSVFPYLLFWNKKQDM